MATLYEDRARIFKAFCDENRLRILELLQSGEKCACRLLEDLNISQPTLSHHMRILCGAGIVKCRKDGKWMHYSLDPAGARHAEEALRHILTIEGDGQDCCKS